MYPYEVINTLQLSRDSVNRFGMPTPVILLRVTKDSSSFFNSPLSIRCVFELLSIHGVIFVPSRMVHVLKQFSDVFMALSPALWKYTSLPHLEKTIDRKTVGKRKTPL